MNEEQKNELNKQQEVFKLVERVAAKLRTKADIEEGIKKISKDLESKFDVKGSHIVALAKELVEQASTRAIEKHNDVIEDLATLKRNSLLSAEENNDTADS